MDMIHEISSEVFLFYFGVLFLWFLSNQTAPVVILDFSQVTLVSLGTSGKTGLVEPDGCK